MIELFFSKCVICSDNSSVLIQRNDIAGANANFFNKSWTDYQQWFGNPSTQYWIGLERLHELSQSNCVLRFDIQAATTGVRYFAQYTSFTVGDSSSNYTLTVGGYSGSFAFDALANHNNRRFMTYDNGTGTCALSNRGGFWWNNCGYVFINSGPASNFRWYNTASAVFTLNVSEVRILC